MREREKGKGEKRGRGKWVRVGGVRRADRARESDGGGEKE